MFEDDLTGWPQHLTLVSLSGISSPIVSCTTTSEAAHTTQGLEDVYYSPGCHEPPSSLDSPQPSQSRNPPISPRCSHPDRSQNLPNVSHKTAMKVEPMEPMDSLEHLGVISTHSATHTLHHSSHIASSQMTQNPAEDNRPSSVSCSILSSQPLCGEYSVSDVLQATTNLADYSDNRCSGGGKLLTKETGPKLVQMKILDSRASVASPGSPDRQHCSSTTQPNSLLDGVKEEEGPKRTCLVCGDVASGFHYGVSSCEACKAFFKRTIQGNIDYTCPAVKDCEINKRRRKACQACRFQKCLRMGMLKEGVRLDRVRGGRQKYRRMMENPYSSFHSPRKITLEENKLLECLTACEPDALLSLPDPGVPHSELKTVSLLADIYDRELVATIGWAKQVPGFTDLSLNDQMRLLQSSWTEVLTLTLVFRSLPRLGKLNFASDFSLSELEASDCGLELFYQKCMLIVERLERLGVTREEFLIMKGLVLANSDCQLEDFSPVKQLRDSLLSSLFDCMAVIRSGNPSLHLQSLLLVLPSLREADAVLRNFWSGVHKAGLVHMNKLLIEMLDA